MNDVLLTPIRLNELETLIENSVRKIFIENNGHDLDHDLAKTESDLVGIKKASELLGLALPTLYALTSSRRIPHSRKGKKLYFSKTELTEWVKSGTRKTISEIETEAENFTSKKK